MMCNATEKDNLDCLLDEKFVENTKFGISQKSREFLQEFGEGQISRNSR